ncbi:Rhodanese- sulfurtransferase [Mitosporidium daphniae]|uniref:Ribosome biogenesis regulatory protein n=1 Tax=Mitosporidium daphniae TaxID=1485682 RepID=A0A098VSI8_9MICR|nr:uncharacterized protein DI09_23p170 [Mitosporidium daphniae]KGG51942.1 hypothetical protein DI09_23p170 [Mitosporidium daphniae]|eukprot:XP_013238369.1 uncharacterized protein DI09_23p170 [Mitosporidium daphniae]
MPPALDLGHLMLIDAENSFSLNSIEGERLALKTAIRNFQLLSDSLSQLPRSNEEEIGTSVMLPNPILALPRAFPAPIPKSEKPPTKWEAFAKKKGIKPKHKRSSHVFDDKISKEWRPRHGSKSAKNDALADWVTELD